MGMRLINGVPLHDIPNLLWSSNDAVALFVWG